MSNLVFAMLMFAGSGLCGWEVWRSLSTGIGRMGVIRGFDRRTSPEEYWFVVIWGSIVSVAGLLVGVFLLAI